MFSFDDYQPKSQYALSEWVPFQELEGLRVRFVSAWKSEGKFGPEVTFIAAVVAKNDKAARVIGSSVNNTLLRNKLGALIDADKKTHDAFPADGVFVKEETENPKATTGFFWNLVTAPKTPPKVEKLLQAAIKASEAAAAEEAGESSSEAPDDFPDGVPF